MLYEVITGDGHVAVLDRPRSDAGENVAAVLRVGDLGLVDGDLQKQVVDVSVVPRRGRDDRDLARQRMRAAETVNLPRITSYNVCYTKLLRMGKRNFLR